MTADPAAYARAGYAIGYAEHGPNPVPDWARADCRNVMAAARTAPDHPLLTEAAVHAGRLAGRRAALERRRQDLYDEHRAVLLAVAATVASAVNPADLAQRIRAHDTTGNAHAGAAADLQRAIAISDQTTPWQTANRQAATAAVLLGSAAATAPRSGGLPPTVDAIDTELASVGPTPATAGVDGATWMAAQAGGWATDLARAARRGNTDEQALADLADALADPVGVAFWLEDDMHQAYNIGFVITATSLGRAINYLAVSDACVQCLDNAAGSPYYSATDVPGIPVHGGCRCWTESADIPALAAA